MKKILSIAIVLILLVLGLFILTGCGSSASKNVDVLDVIDEYAGYKISMEYPNDQGIEITDSGSGNRVVKTLTDNGVSMELKYLTGTVNDNKKTDTTNKLEITEYDDINGQKAYVAYDEKRKTAKFTYDIANDPQNNPQGYIVFQMDLSVDKNSDTDLKEYIGSEKFTNIINSVKYENVEPKQVDGILNFTYEYGTKVSAPSGYEITHNTLDGLEVYLKKDGEQVASVKLKLVASAKTVDEQVEKEKTSSLYTGEVVETTFGSSLVKFLPFANSKATAWKERNYGYTQKDDNVMIVDYIIYEDGVDKEVTNKFVADILDNMFFVNK